MGDAVEYAILNTAVVFGTKFGNAPPAVIGFVKNVKYLVEAVRLLLKYIGRPQWCLRQKGCVA